MGDLSFFRNAPFRNEALYGRPTGSGTPPGPSHSHPDLPIRLGWPRARDATAPCACGLVPFPRVRPKLESYTLSITNQPTLRRFNHASFSFTRKLYGFTRLLSRPKPTHSSPRSPSHLGCMCHAHTAAALVSSWGRGRGDCDQRVEYNYYGKRSGWLAL